MARMIRISIQGHVTSSAEWITLARTAEASGFDALYAPDHPGTSAAPFVALAAAASVTKRIRLGTCVVNAGHWDPVGLATELATLDALSEGRAVFGIGAGHTPAEWTMRGLGIPSPAKRIDRMIELITAVRALLSRKQTNMSGSHFDLDEAVLTEPHLFQSPIPLMVGGNGPRLLKFAAESADIVGVTGLGRTMADGHSHEADWTCTSLNRRFDLIRSSAANAGRKPDVEVLVQHVEITDRPEPAADRIADIIPGASAEDVLAAPFIWIGTEDFVVTQIRQFQLRWGVNRYVVRANARDQASRIANHLREHP